MTRTLMSSVLLMAALLVGCRSTYDSRYFFEPRPAEVRLPDRPVGTLVTVIGVRRADDDAGLPACIEVRWRIENRGDEPVRFDGSSFRLISADLQALAAPIVEPAGMPPIAPGATAHIVAYFPFPAGLEADDLDLTGLVAHWALDFADRKAHGSASFAQTPRYYPYPYPHHAYFGFGYHGHW